MTWPLKLMLALALLLAGFAAGVKFEVGVVAARDLAQRQSDDKIHARQLDRNDKAAAGFEADKTKIRTQFLTITKEVERVTQSPVYSNICVDDDGLRLIATAINPAAAAGQPAPAVPGPADTP